jgi:hypothetical protein
LALYFQFQLIFSEQLLGIQLSLLLHCAFIHLLTSLPLEFDRRTIDSPEILLAQLLTIELLYRIEPRPYLLLKAIGLVFTDIPIKIEEPVRARIGFSCDKWFELPKKVERQIGLLDGIEISFIFYLHVSDQLVTLLSLEKAIYYAKRTSNDCQEGRIVSIFNTFIHHIECIARAKHMPNEHEISCSIQAIEWLQNLVK